ncbi:hypothetical protein GSI_15308 [Ganoderma sinense ZZ0214-1]|uniref:DUF6533 domain-containing protein n=1 Tax=Ganoderma sinense ZZ0214-1 TaxID=1077348 RepID=A0A2G8RMT3_9APHY|nr:hypothetical protein GSI_15308 [Ganoderma sinense ZZ0214-1]
MKEAAESIIQEVAELRITAYVGLASYTVLVYDHLLTLDDEIKYIWKKKKGSPLIWLFFLNRYMTPLAFIGNLCAYLSGTFTYEKCTHYVRYEGATTMIGINIASLMMLLRIYAMYETQKFIVAFVAIIFCLEFGTNAWLLSHGIAVHHSPQVKACSMIFDSSRLPGVAASATAWTVLVYDTIVLLLTIFKTYSSLRYKTVAGTMRTLLKEGVAYYSVIFSVTLVLTLMIAFAPPGIQNLCAQMEYLLTVTMMSRITLHLKRAAHLQEIRESTLRASTMTTAQWRPGSDVHFARLGPAGYTGCTTQNMPYTPLNITVSEQTVTHNDNGEEGCLSHKSMSGPPLSYVGTSSPMGSKSDGREEWHEFSQLRSKGEKDLPLVPDRTVDLDKC